MIRPDLKGFIGAGAHDLDGVVPAQAVKRDAFLTGGNDPNRAVDHDLPGAGRHPRTENERVVLDRAGVDRPMPCVLHHVVGARGSEIRVSRRVTHLVRRDRGRDGSAVSHPADLYFIVRRCR